MKLLFVLLSVFCHFPSNLVCDGQSKATPQRMPIVIWPGMGDSCHNEWSMGDFVKYLRHKIPGAYVHCLSIGDTWFQTTKNSFLSNVDYKIKLVCERLKNDEKLKHGFHAIGFSQGSQFLRGVAQRCPDPPMKNLVSVGGQHQGVFGLPICSNLAPVSNVGYVVCDYVRWLTSVLAYLPVVRHYVVQAQFWHDPHREDTYRGINNFLSDLNQETHFKASYKANLQKLDNFVLIQFQLDSMVTPIESQWFGFYKRGQSEEMETLQESRLYEEDLLGLREMEKKGKLHFLSVRGDHLQMDQQFLDNLVKRFLT